MALSKSDRALVPALWLLAASCRMLRRVSPQRKVIYVVQVAKQGSFGDEAMMRGAFAQLPPEVKRGVVVLVAGDDFSGLFPGADQISLTRFFDGRFWALDLFALFRMLMRADGVILIGADVMDGKYHLSRSFRRMLLAWVSARSGVSTGLVSFSFRADAQSELRDWMRQLAAASVWISPRDPLSRDVVQALVGSQVEQAADLAFLSTPDPAIMTATGKQAANWISTVRSEGGSILFANISPTPFRLDVQDGDISWAVEKFTELLSDLVENTEGLHVLLLPHDSRGVDCDPVLCDRVLGALDVSIKSRFFAGSRVSSSDIGILVGMTCFGISMRMHLGIAALNQGVPCCFLDYQGKVRGLLKHFSVDELFFERKELNAIGSLSKKLRTMLEQRERYANDIARHLPDVRAAAKRNLRFHSWESQEVQE